MASPAASFPIVPIPVPNRVLDDPDDWEYFGEGANNVLYRYVGADSFFKPYLLRLRKLLPGSPTTQKLHHHLHSRFGPLMNEYLMRTEIIALSSFLIPALNILLTSVNEDEPTDWAGRPVNPPTKKRRLLDEKEPWGLLVEDMSCGNYLYLYPPAPSRRRSAMDDGDEDVDMEGEDEGEIWKDMAMIEFKPKWLTQSPNAPANWKLCRTCAVRLMQSHKSRERQGQQGEECEPEAAELCPLDLSSGDPVRIEKATFAIVNMDNAVMIADPTPPSDDDDEAEDGSPLPPNINEQLAAALSNSLVTLLTNFFRTSSIIPLLTQLQSRFGSRGVFTSATLQLMGENDTLPSEEELRRAGMATGEKYEVAIADEDDIWTAMTLRDCSLFLKVWVRKRRGRGMEAKVECKVGDLDLKGGEGGRAVYWRDVERRLRMGGWYTGKRESRNCRTGEE